MEDGRGDVAGGLGQLVVAGDLRAGLVFLRIEARQGRLGGDFTGQLNRLGGDHAVGFGRQIVGPDGRLIAGIGRVDMHRSPAFRPKVADRGGKGRKIVQRVAKFIQAQGLDVELDIRGFLRLVRLGESSQLAGRHGQRTRLEQQILQPHHRFTNQRIGPLVEGLGVLHLEDGADLQMVLQVFSHPGQGVFQGDPLGLQHLAPPDAGQLEKLRRTDRARRKNHLAAHRGRGIGAIEPELHAGDLFLAVDRRHGQLLGLGVGRHRQVLAMGDRLQETFRGIPAHPPALVDLEIANAFVVAAVEIAAFGDPRLLGGIGEGVKNLPAQTLFLDPPLAALAMQVRAALKVIFRALEQRQDIVPSPAFIAHLPPGVIVAGLAAHVDHAVDRRTAPQHLAARIVQGATVEAGVGFGLETPVGARIAHAIEVADRDMDPVIVVLAPRL